MMGLLNKKYVYAHRALGVLGARAWRKGLQNVKLCGKLIMY